MRSPLISRRWTCEVPGWRASTCLSADTLSMVHCRVGRLTASGRSARAPEKSGTTRSLANSVIRSSWTRTFAPTSTTASSAISAPHCEYACGKNITSIPPVRSSNCAEAQGIPFLFTRRFTPTRMPPTRTWVSLGTSPLRMAGIWVSTWLASRWATPLSGWPDT